MLFLALMLSVPLACAQDGQQPPVRVAGQDRDGNAPGPLDVLLADNFDDAELGLLPQFSPNPAYDRGYDEGEYFIRKLDPEFTRLPLGVIPGSYGDTMLAIDARIVGESEGRYIALECRRSATGWYRAYVDTTQGRFWLARWDGDDEILLTERMPSDAIAAGDEVNHLELTCAGNVVGLGANGTELANVQDGTYSAGGLAIGASVFTTSRNTVEARFDNLVVYEAAAPMSEQRSELAPRASS